MGLSGIDHHDRVPFLEKEEIESSPQVAIQKAQRSRRLLSIIALLSVAVHVALSLLWFRPWHSYFSASNATSKTSSLYNPFHGVVRNKIEQWPDDAWDNSVYTGPPRRELDEAWDKLQKVQGVRVTPQEAVEANLTSKIFLENGDQAAIMGYYHNLHCIRYIYQKLHPDIYARGDDPGHIGLGHSYHCLEVLRRSVLCQPDLTLQAIHWQDDQKIGMDLEPQSLRECVDFNAIYEFSETRKFSRDMIVDA